MLRGRNDSFLLTQRNVGTRISIRNTRRSLLCIAWLIHHTYPNTPRPSNLSCFNTLVHLFFSSLIFFRIFATTAQSFTILLCVKKETTRENCSRKCFTTSNFRWDNLLAYYLKSNIINYILAERKKLSNFRDFNNIYK